MAVASGQSLEVLLGQLAATESPLADGAAAGADSCVSANLAAMPNDRRLSAALIARNDAAAAKATAKAGRS